MKDVCPFGESGNWYKGNLHCHSNVSDGKLKPEEVVDIYKSNGYSFLAFSEHEVFTNWTKFNTKDFLIIPAIERGIYPRSSKCFHIHGIQGSKAFRENSSKKCLEHMDQTMPPKFEGKETVQTVINELIDSGNLVMFNHPNWSFNELDDFVDLEGYFALEIFNYGCEVEERNGLSTIYWDSLLRRGKRVWGIATDDNHNNNKFGEAKPSWDSLGGWVSLKCKELTQDAIADALLEGRFYSSSGPEIYDFGVENGKVFVECSPVERIYFITESHANSRMNGEGETISSSTYEITGRENYIRVECVDKYGKTAWTNPIFVE